MSPTNNTPRPDIETLGGLRKEVIEERINNLRRESDGVCRRIEQIEKVLLPNNGNPGLEERLRQFMSEKLDQFNRHGNNNMKEGDLYVLKEIEHEREDRVEQHKQLMSELERHRKDGEEKHKENQKTSAKMEEAQKRIERFMYAAIGALLLFKFLGIDNLLHWVKQ